MIAENGQKITLRKIDKIFIALFFISWLHSALGLLFYIALIYYWQKLGTEGALKALIFATTRSILSRAVAAVPMFAIFKWIILIGSAIWIFMRAKLSGDKDRTYRKIMYATLIFAAVAFLSGIYLCSYPITSMFKIFSFSLIFLAVLKGIAATVDEVNWNDFLLSIYAILFIISFVLIPFSRFRITNDDFQGVFNHVNIFGIIGALFVAIVLKSDYMKNHKWQRLLLILSTFYMIFLSASRTGMFSAILVWLVYMLFEKKFSSKIVSYLLGILIVGTLVVLFSSKLQDVAFEFIYKNGNTSSIWESRSELAKEYIRHYERSNLLGTGFMVPYREGVRDFSLSLGLIIEPGNLLWTLLGDVGILGFMAFLILFVIILLSGRKQNILLLVAAFMVCMGEMVFFSPNNMSVLIYSMIGIYLFDVDLAGYKSKKLYK